MIREMRNACTHSQNPLTFRDEASRNAVFTMLDDESAASYRDDYTYIRLAFVMLTGVLASIIIDGDVWEGTSRVNTIIKQLMDEREDAEK